MQGEGMKGRAFNAQIDFKVKGHRTIFMKWIGNWILLLASFIDLHHMNMNMTCTCVGRERGGKKSRRALMQSHRGGSTDWYTIKCSCIINEGRRKDHFWCFNHDRSCYHTSSNSMFFPCNIYLCSCSNIIYSSLMYLMFIKI